MTICYILLFIPPIIGLIFSFLEFLWLRKIHINGPEDKTDNIEDGLNRVDKMKEVTGYIAEGANAFLKKEYQYLSVFIVVFSLIIILFVNTYTAISFVFGCLTSILCGYIGMKISVYANIRAANETWKGLDKGYNTTINAGAIMGFSLVSLGLIALCLLLVFFRNVVFVEKHSVLSLYSVVAGFGLGASSIALFSRVGGGIYTKAADVGADLSGKNEYGIPEDDIRNPACIADNVGDNVGDIAGMGADLFGSLAESLCAALVIGATTINPPEDNHDIFSFLLYPLMFTSCSIIVGIITFFVITKTVKIKDKADVEKSLKYMLFLSTILQSFVIVAVQYFVIPKVLRTELLVDIEKYRFIIPSLIGLYSGLIIGLTTEFYTSYSFKPVQEIADTQKVSAATGIIYGLSLGYKSTLIPIICLSLTLGISYFICGAYGIALAAVGMLSTVCISLTIDAYGPISDNAGGIAEMAGLPSEVRERTDILDAAGNTTAAIGKGFAIGSATLVAFALFTAYAGSAKFMSVNILNPWVLIGLLIGSMLPYLFSALTMKSVAIAANSVLNECLAQFPLILSEKQKPDYAKCILISTDASLKQMILPGIISIFSPLLIGILMGKFATAGLLIGIILSGVQLAFSSTNSGGAWDNAKKYIESGALGTEHSKGSNAHKNSVIGDTVGDPLKDTSGPSLNILIKLSAITALVFANVIATNFTSARGGPIWLKD